MKPYMRDLPPLEHLHRPPFGNLRELGSIEVALRDLDLLGTPDEEDDPEAFFAKHGLPPEPQRLWFLRGDCGLEFILAQNFLSGDVVVFADESAEFEHVLAHLPFDHALVWKGQPREDETQRRSGRGGWFVTRLDDRGNPFDIESLSRERSARCLARLFELRGHKQSYFVELRGVAPIEPPVESGPFRWALWRQDENGNRFLIHRAPGRGYLEALADAFNREPRHKQHFFVEAIDTASP